MRRTRWAVLCCLASLVCILAGCSVDDGYIKRRIEELEGLEEKAEGEAESKIKAMRKKLKKEFKALPKGDERKEALSKLARKARKQLKQARALLKAKEQEEDEEEDEELEEYKKTFFGKWEGGGMKLYISSGGKVTYSRKKGSGTRSVTAPIKSFSKKKFKVGLLGLNTTFKINKAPHEEDGEWKMTIDGVELTRLAGGSGPKLGIFICTKVANRSCTNPQKKFPTTVAKIYMTYATRTIPEDGQSFIVYWKTDDVGKAAPPNFTIAKTPLTWKAKKKATSFNIKANISRPTKGWPVGSYRVEIRSGKDLIISTGFRIVKKAAEEDEED